HLLVDRHLSDEGLGVLRAPPVEFLPALAPVPAIPLTDGGDDVAVVLHLILSAERQLPAHLGFVLERVHPTLERGQMEGAAGAGAEPWTVQKDAGVALDPGHDLAELVGPDHRLLRAVVLPLVRGEGLGDLLDSAGILLVDEVRAIAAASLRHLGGRTGEHPLATFAEDALPIAGQEGDIEDPGA